MYNRSLQTLLAFAAVPCLLFAQSGTNDKAPKVATALLSKPADMGTYEVQMFEEDPRKIKFRLVTSWIPGEKHQGMFRYKMDAWKADEATAEAVEKLLQRVSLCTITLELYDKDGFVVRRHVVPFHRGVNEQARLHSLYANDAFQMDAQEYRQFVNSGAWAVSWDCGFMPAD